MTQVNKKAKTSPIGCNWVFTWNNYNDKKAPQAWPDMAQLVYQCEICPETKTPHLQGYVRFKKNKRFNAVKALDSDKIHWELRRGTHEQARDYASKEESRDPGPDSGPWFIGDDPCQGHRTDLDEAAKALREGVSLQTLAAEMPSTVIRYSRGLQHYKMLVTADRSVKTELIILWGPPGTGKSHRARTKWPDAYWLSRGNGQNIWWDSYAGQKVVIIDEFTGWMTKDQFCRLVDGTPFMVDTKGGRVPFAAELVVCTSNQDPWTWWEAPLHGVQRRLEEAEINHMTKEIASQYRKKRKYTAKDDDANIIHQIDGDDQRQRAVSTADYGSPVPVPDGYAVPTYAPKSNNDGWASTKGCKESGCNAHWIIGGTGYCIMHSKE